MKASSPRVNLGRGGILGPPAERKTDLSLTPDTGAPRWSGPTPSGVRPADALQNVIVSSLEDAKAEDIISIDISGKTTIADRMIIASGRSTTHVGAIADRVIRACREAGFPAPRTEGLPLCDWVLLDARDAIVHIFRPDVRHFYNLEKIWSADRPGEPKAG